MQVILPVMLEVPDDHPWAQALASLKGEALTIAASGFVFSTERPTQCRTLLGQAVLSRSAPNKRIFVPELRVRPNNGAPG